ncbi:GNAT family N-acetyltransferase [Algicella marina]|uniref:GNAT family N-acetyltransferase n=1 Tax=Algicella marina TaxID=2683284 RepID=A0A6P1SYG3_9RHOB|nr:GNAT family N-acetyltransferase [Algicella marina]QHQ35724.1 GNAT family N-acetyltransferase [Algicella marina]
MTEALTLRRDDALGPDTLAMIGESEAELAAIYPPEVRSAFSPEELRASGVRMVVAHRCGRPVGCGGVAVLDGYGELKRIFVTRAARGTGVVQAILKHLEQEARAEGLALMRLETGDASPEAIRAYERQGYVRRGPFGAYRENGSSVFMEKAI